ncbi:MAG: alpha/beta fold hydrolase [Anaerolineales bacterium]|jgi:3-oxoadipate enol-lactonase
MNFIVHRAQGSGSDPIVLLHGLGSSGEDWPLQFSALSKQHDVYAPDLPGHGGSAPLPGWPTMDEYAAVLADWMGEQGISSAHVVGLSLGGLVALQLGVDHPRLVKSLVIVNAFSRMKVSLRGGLHSAGRLFLLVFGRMDWLGAWVAAALFPEDEQEGFRELAAQRIASNPRRSYLQAVAAIARFNLGRHMSELGCPVLVVAGARDLIVPMSAKRSLANSVSTARFEVLPDSGHVTPIDAADRFNALLLDFIEAAVG